MQVPHLPGKFHSTKFIQIKSYGWFTTILVIRRNCARIWYMLSNPFQIIWTQYQKRKIIQRHCVNMWGEHFDNLKMNTTKSLTVTSKGNFYHSKLVHFRMKLSGIIGFSAKNNLKCQNSSFKNIKNVDRGNCSAMFHTTEMSCRLLSHFDAIHFHSISIFKYSQRVLVLRWYWIIRKPPSQLSIECDVRLQWYRISYQIHHCTYFTVFSQLGTWKQFWIFWWCWHRTLNLPAKKFISLPKIPMNKMY